MSVGPVRGPVPCRYVILRSWSLVVQHPDGGDPDLPDPFHTAVVSGLVPVAYRLDVVPGGSFLTPVSVLPSAGSGTLRVPSSRSLRDGARCVGD